MILMPMDWDGMGRRVRLRAVMLMISELVVRLVSYMLYVYPAFTSVGPQACGVKLVDGGFRRYLG